MLSQTLPNWLHAYILHIKYKTENSRLHLTSALKITGLQILISMHASITTFYK